MRSTQIVKVGDAALECIIHGVGDVVVLLPGGGLDAGTLDGLAERLARAGFRAISVNPRGASASVGTLEALTWHTFAADVAGVIEALAGRPAHVAGHGFSNRLAGCLATDRPDLVKSVILLAGVGLAEPEPDVVKALRAWFRPDATQAECLAAVERLVADPAAAPSIFRQLTRWPRVAAAQDAADHATPREHWSGFGSGAAVLVVQALEDRVARPAHGHALRARLGDRVHLAEIQQAGHLLPVEKPEATAEAMIAFLRRQAA